MELKLEHLAPYLPYELRLSADYFNINKSFLLVLENNSNSFGNGLTINDVFRFNAKPILKPLSDLKKCIKNDISDLHEIALDLGLIEDDNYIFQYDFVEDNHSYKVVNPKNNSVIVVYKSTEDLLKYGMYNVVNELIKNHYDVFGLIENGLATIKE